MVILPQKCSIRYNIADKKSNGKRRHGIKHEITKSGLPPFHYNLPHSSPCKIAGKLHTEEANISPNLGNYSGKLKLSRPPTAAKEGG